jgi:hypothetical protein
MSNRSIGLYRYQQWCERLRSLEHQASLVRRIDPVTGRVVEILPPTSKPKRHRRKPVRIVWRSYDDVVMTVLNAMSKEGERR